MHDQWYLVWKENNRLKIMVSQKKTVRLGEFFERIVRGEKKEEKKSIFFDARRKEGL